MRLPTLGTAVSCILLFARSLSASQPVTLTLESREPPHGDIVRLELLLKAPSNSAPAGLQWTFRLRPGLEIVDIKAGKALEKARKTLACKGPKCIVYGLNRTTIPNGLIAVARIKVAQSSGEGKQSAHIKDEAGGRARLRKQEVQLSELLAVSLDAKPIRMVSGEEVETKQRQQ